jgi:hypothetical protein
VWIKPKELCLTEKYSQKEIKIIATERPRRKILEMFDIVLQQEHKKLAAKTSKNSKKKKIILDASSNSSKKDMSLDHITVSTTGKVDSPSKKQTDKTDKDKTYQSRISKPWCNHK